MTRRSTVVVAVATVLTVAATVLVGALGANQRYYSRHLAIGDGQGTYYLVARAMRMADADGVLKAGAVPIARDQYALQPLSAALGAPMFPRDMRIGPILNGLWFLVMACCSAVFFAEKAASVSAAVALALPPILYPPVVTSPYNGLTNLHSDLLGYTLGAGTLSLVLLAGDMGGMKIPVAAGALAGLTLIGRFPAAAVVFVMLAPPLLLKARRREISWRGLAIVALVAVVVAGPWLVLQLSKVVGYAITWYGHPRGAIGQLGWSRVFPLLKGYVKWLFGGDPVYAATLILLGALVRRRAAGVIMTLDWTLAWMAFAPLLVLLWFRSENVFYAYPAPFAFFLCATSPCGAVRWGRREQLLAAAIVSVLAARNIQVLWRLHDAPSEEKAAARDIANLILTDARARGCGSSRPVSVAMTYWGALNPYSLAVFFDLDLGIPATVHSKGEASGTAAVIVENAVVWQDPSDPAASDVQRLAAAVTAADYAVVLGVQSRSSGAYWQRESWGTWSQAGQLLREWRFDSIGAPRRVTDLEEAQTLRAAGACATRAADSGS